MQLDLISEVNKYRILVIITRPLIKPVSLILPEFSAINKFIISEMGKFH